MDFLLQNCVIIFGTVATSMIFVKWFRSEKYASNVKKYVEFFDKKDTTNRISKYNVMVDNFYTIVTDFYMWGWGESFHFAPRNKDETFKESIKRLEYYLSSRLGLTKYKYALDVGCGVGGPMRNIHHFSGVKIDGITLNNYQVIVGNKLNKNIPDCKIFQGDFMKLSNSFKKNTYDAVYEIEATCHAPDRKKCFSEIFQVLKPGGYFGGYEWIMTDKYDKENEIHNKIKFGIEAGNSLPILTTKDNVLDALVDSGFEIIDHFDVCIGSEIPWYHKLGGNFSFSNIKCTRLGRLLILAMLKIFEKIGIAKQGVSQVQNFLSNTAEELVKGGQLEIFTPSYFFLARKPLD